MAKQVEDTLLTDLFKTFCKQRHAEDKGRNFDLLQEVYSKTELFDLSLLPLDTKEFPKDIMEKHYFEGEGKEWLVVHSDRFKEFTIPFEAVFCKLPDIMGTELVFMREYNPTVITGTVDSIKDSYELNSPFKIDLENCVLRISMIGLYRFANSLRIKKYGENIVEEAIKVGLMTLVANIYFALVKLNNLPKHSVATDTPKKAEYYTRKHASTIKVIKPIYYVLDKKEEKNPISFKRIRPLGQCCFDHSFLVRGHWRRINPNTYGKNRSGEYVVTTGFTWVKEHTRGDGDLVKKIRVLK